MLLPCCSWSTLGLLRCNRCAVPLNFTPIAAFTAFYENCPVLKSEAEQRASRPVLCDLTARVLKQGLDVLGIETVEQM
jgi:DALR anticodon binding domain